MFEKIRDRMREKIRDLEYVMTVHAEEEMENDSLSIYDIENAILTGNIIERQQDHETEEWKYLIAGKTIDETDIIVVVKLSVAKKLVIITVIIEEATYEN